MHCDNSTISILSVFDLDMEVSSRVQCQIIIGCGLIVQAQSGSCKTMVFFISEESLITISDLPI